MDKFKVGDRVEHTWEGAGTIVSMVSIVGGDIHLKLDSGKLGRGIGHSWITSKFNIKKIKGGEEVMTFKGGDKVKVKKDCTGCKEGVVYTLLYGFRSGESMSKLIARGVGKEIGCACKDNWIKVEEDVVVFRVGDKVKIVKKFEGRTAWNHAGRMDETINKIGVIIGFGTQDNVLNVEFEYGSSWRYDQECLIKIGGEMTLRQRIEALDDGWNKEADDILWELTNGKKEFEFFVRNGFDDGGYVVVRERGWGTGLEGYPKRFVSEKGEQMRFAFFYQCGKMQAFKDALLYLLDKSGLEKKTKSKGDKLTIETEDGQTLKVRVLDVE